MTTPQWTVDDLPDDLEADLRSALVLGLALDDSDQATDHVTDILNAIAPHLVADVAAARLVDDSDRIRDVVYRALDNAVANGYEIAGPDAEAADLAGLDADLEGVPVGLIAPHVAARRAARLVDDMAAVVDPEHPLYVDIESEIHQHLRDGGESDEWNDWATDLTAAIARLIVAALHHARQEEELEPKCICRRFRDTGGYRIADLACPVHGVGGTNPGDGPWEDESDSTGEGS